MQSYRFLTEIWSDRNPKLPIVSSSWKSLTEQERLDDAYTRFVVGLHEKIAAAKGSPRLQAGAIPFLYWPGVVIFAAICLATIGVLVRALQQGETATTLLLLAFFAFLVWQLGRFFKRNMPRRYTLDDIPNDVLPIARR
jgi:TRAP-type C4-dicarboxylate transport system permease small subunit